jgi:excisionase family DNA binding protein
VNKHRPDNKRSRKGRRLDAKAIAARQEARAAKRAAAAMVGPEEVAKALGRGKNQTYDDIAAGRIPAKRYGRRWLIARAWLDAETSAAS